MKRLVIATALVLAQICSAGLTNVYVGTGPDSGTGDPLRTAFMKLNTNDVYLEAYITSARASAYGTNFNAAATNWITTAIASGDSATAAEVYSNLVSIISTNTVASASNVVDNSISWPMLDTNLQALVQLGTNLPAGGGTGGVAVVGSYGITAPTNSGVVTISVNTNVDFYTNLASQKTNAGIRAQWQADATSSANTVLNSAINSGLVVTPMVAAAMVNTQSVAYAISNRMLLGYFFGHDPGVWDGVPKDLTDENVYLSTSLDGTNWTQLTLGCIQPTNIAPGWCRSPAIFEHHGKFWSLIQYLDPRMDTHMFESTGFGIGLAANGLTERWTLQCSNNIPLANVRYVWGGCIYEDEVGGVHCIVPLGFTTDTGGHSNRAHTLYYTYATDTNGLTTWSEPVELTGEINTNSTVGVRDPFLRKVGDEFELWWISNEHSRPCYSRSTNIASGYVQQQPIGWLDSWGRSFEALSLGICPDGKLRLYGDDFSANGAMVSTSDGGSEGPWSAPQELLNTTRGRPMRAISVITPTNNAWMQTLSQAMLSPRQTARRHYAIKLETQTIASDGAHVASLSFSNQIPVANLGQAVNGPFDGYGSRWTAEELGWYRVYARIPVVDWKTNAGTFQVLLNSVANQTTYMVCDPGTNAVAITQPIILSTNLYLRSGDTVCVAVWQTLGHDVRVGGSATDPAIFSVEPLEAGIDAPGGDMRMSVYDPDMDGRPGPTSGDQLTFSSLSVSGLVISTNVAPIKMIDRGTGLQVSLCVSNGVVVVY